MPGPTPDYDTVTVIWQRANDDRTAPQGWVYLKYDGGLRVSDGIPVGTKEWKRKVRRTVLVKEGDPHRYVIGEAIFTDVPASNDPDVQGGGGSWTIREELVGTESRTYQFYADADAEDGVVMVGPLGPAEPDPGTVYSVVTVADFTGLTSRVTGLEENPGGGGVGTVLSVNSVEPVEGDVPLTLADLPDVGEALADKADLVDGKVDPEQLPPYPVGERHVAEDQTAMLALDAGLGDICIRLDLNTRWLLTSSDPTTLADWIQLDDSGWEAALAGKADTSHTHAASDITTGTLDLARLPSGVRVQVDYVMSGGINGSANAWPASRPSGAGVIELVGPLTEYQAGRPTWQADNDHWHIVG